MAILAQIEEAGSVVQVPPVPLDRTSAAPLAVQLADGVRAAAMRGALRPGDRLPSTRALAAELGVSRTVTAAAYDQLLAEGWVRGRTGAGTFVTAAPSDGARAPVARPAPAGDDRPRPARGSRRRCPRACR